MLKVNHTDEHSSLRSTAICIGGGYGYNYVPHKNWLIHISALPTFAVYEDGKIQLGGQEERLKRDYPGIIIAGRGAITYTQRNMFYGVNMTYNYSTLGSEKAFQIQQTKYRCRLYVGIKLF